MGKKGLALILFCSGLWSACGASKTGHDEPFLPPLEKVPPPPEDSETLSLKSEELNLTHFMQTWKWNRMEHNSGAEKFLHLQKRFIFPIQFNGWIQLDGIGQNHQQCGPSQAPEPIFILEDDHRERRILSPREKIPVSISRLYALRVEFTNLASCTGVEIRFGVLYGRVE